MGYITYGNYTRRAGPVKPRVRGHPDRIGPDPTLSGTRRARYAPQDWQAGIASLTEAIVHMDACGSGNRA